MHDNSKDVAEDVVLWIGRHPPLPAQARQLSRLGALEIYTTLPKSADDIVREYIMPRLGRGMIYVVLVAPAQYKIHLLSRVRNLDDVMLLEVMREKVHESDDVRDCNYTLQERDRERCWMSTSGRKCVVYCHKGFAVLRDIKVMLEPLAL